MSIDPLTDNNLLEGDPITGKPASPPKSTKPTSTDPDEETAFERLLVQVRETGSLGRVRKLSTHGLSVLMILLSVWIVQNLIPGGQVPASESSYTSSDALAAGLPIPTPTAALPALPAFEDPETIDGVGRTSSNYHTEIPNRARVDVITYTVETGDTVFGIAERFSLNPETILWGNYAVLADNPHSLQPGQILNILPVNGTYHRWSAGENLGKVAQFYGVNSDAITEWPGNPIEPIGFNPDDPEIDPGTLLIVPGGQREMVDYGIPVIQRSDPAAANTFGTGYCSTVTDGAIGTGTFIWPANSHFLSGYDYSPATNHRAIDVDGETGDPALIDAWGLPIVIALRNEDGRTNAYLVSAGKDAILGTADDVELALCEDLNL